MKDPIDAGIDAGLKACDLMEVSKEDVICRSHLRKFLETALVAVELAEAKQAKANKARSGVLYQLNQERREA